MATRHEKTEKYHEQFAARIIKALEAGTAPWQKPWKAGERILPHNFGSGRDYRGGNAVYLAITRWTAATPTRAGEATARSRKPAAMSARARRARPSSTSTSTAGRPCATIRASRCSTTPGIR